MLTRKRAICAKKETVEGTAETLTQTEGGILVYDPKITLPANWYERDFLRASLSRGPAIHGTRPFQLTFRTELVGSGTAGTAPKWGPYLKACGFDEDIVAVTSVTYHPASAAVDSLTMALYDDGVIFKGKGIRGNVKISGKIGEPVFLDFDFQGVLESVLDGAVPTGITYPSIIPVAMQGTDIFSVHTYNPVFTALDIDMANTVALRENANAEAGILSALITGRNPTGSIDPELTTVAAHDWYGKWTSGATGTLSLALTGTAGNICTITAPALQYRELTDAERNGISARTVGFSLALSAGDDEIQIALT